MKQKNFRYFGLTLALASLGWVLLTPALFPAPPPGTAISAAHPGFAAPVFTLQTLEDETLSLTDFHGRPVLVFLWASWCSVCKAAMPGLQAVYETYGPDGFAILAVNTTYQDTLVAAVDYFTAREYTYPMLLDRDGAVSRAYQVYALPTSVLVNPDGTVSDVIIGSGLSEGFLRARVETLLNPTQ